VRSAVVDIDAPNVAPSSSDPRPELADAAEPG
jgi:hypothetical protein